LKIIFVPQYATFFEKKNDEIHFKLYENSANTEDKLIHPQFLAKL
jgi:hypothetical protein